MLQAAGRSGEMDVMDDKNALDLLVAFQDRACDGQ